MQGVNQNGYSQLPPMVPPPTYVQPTVVQPVYVAAPPPQQYINGVYPQQYSEQPIFVGQAQTTQPQNDSAQSLTICLFICGFFFVLLWPFAFIASRKSRNQSTRNLGTSALIAFFIYVLIITITFPIIFA
ncbi:hypothetical protein EIN_122900 [Entamoeba invadens IP1]|uniref:Uncharacterized protein n=1 Tax=Entamoeba invadens IP1 TaxID=370355 RepID=A0A0A1UG48_ENTIV|nr:hypothetical protein EIN_122900 [Entamoeba invadens IP1]ELP92339.1 hypothetical protein EIN_122900 [Entamoeba invadens IP1]|eukprot:XP_004259110.1 hypothetical protein EIN_122900 [Entamoeba invadens IP1]